MHQNQGVMTSYTKPAPRTTHAPLYVCVKCFSLRQNCKNKMPKYLNNYNKKYTYDVGVLLHTFTTKVGSSSLLAHFVILRCQAVEWYFKTCASFQSSTYFDMSHIKIHLDIIKFNILTSSVINNTQIIRQLNPYCRQEHIP